MKIAGSTAFVTGANRGLGRALAAELIARGARVYAGARQPESVDIPGAIPVAIDITDPASVAAAAALAGDVNLLINNAGISTGTSLLDRRLRQRPARTRDQLPRPADGDPGLRAHDRGQRRRHDSERAVGAVVGQPAADRRLQRGQVGGLVDDQCGAPGAGRRSRCA